MQQALDMAARGHGQMVAVVGEPGVGKSRLVHEFAQGVPHGFLVLDTFALSYGTTFPYLPLIELLQRYFSANYYNAFIYQQIFLQIVLLRARWEGRLPLSVNNSVPGDFNVIRRIAQCVSHQTGVPGQPDHLRNLAVGGDFSAGDLVDLGADFSVV